MIDWILIIQYSTLHSVFAAPETRHFAFDVPAANNNAAPAALSFYQKRISYEAVIVKQPQAKVSREGVANDD